MFVTCHKHTHLLRRYYQHILQEVKVQMINILLCISHGTQGTGAILAWYGNRSYQTWFLSGLIRLLKIKRSWMVYIAFTHHKNQVNACNSLKNSLYLKNQSNSAKLNSCQTWILAESCNWKSQPYVWIHQWILTGFLWRFHPDKLWQSNSQQLLLNSIYFLKNTGNLL